MRQVALALHNYHDANGVMPPGQPLGYFSGSWYTVNPAPADYNRSNWGAFILPYIEQTALDSQVQAFLRAPTTHTLSQAFARVVIPTLVCPSDPNGGKISTLGQGFHTSYLVVHGSSFATPTADPQGLNLDGMFYGRSKVRLTDVTDGTSNTAMVSEILQSPDTGTHDVRGRLWNTIHAGTTVSTMLPPNSATGDNTQGYCVAIPGVPCASQSTTNAYVLARSRHTGGVNVAMGDASVRFITNNITPSTWVWMGTRNGGEVIPGN